MKGTPKGRLNSTLKSTDFEPNTKVIQELETLTYKFLGLTSKSSHENAFFGYVPPFYCPKLVVFIMERWVQWVDRRLDKLERTNFDGFVRLIGERVFTLEEFRLVLSYELPEETYIHHRVFDYLQITDKIEKVLFSSKFKNDDKDILEYYIEVITPYILAESPTLRSFFFERTLKVFLPHDARKRHIYHMAKSGWGKSECMKIVIYDEQYKSQKSRNRTLVLMEPGGDLSTEVLRFKMNYGEQGRDRLIYLDTNIRKRAIKLFSYMKDGKQIKVDILKQDYTFVINPFELEDKSEDNIGYLVQELQNAFFNILNDSSKNSLSEQMQSVLKSCLFVLIRKGDATLSDLKRFLHDDLNDDLVQLGIQDPNQEVATFFHSYKTDSILRSTKSSMFFKLHNLLVTPVFRRLLVGKSTVNLEQALNSGKVIIFNLVKGKMGADAAQAYGKLVMAYIMGIIRKRDDKYFALINSVNFRKWIFSIDFL